MNYCKYSINFAADCSLESAMKIYLRQKRKMLKTYDRRKNGATCNTVTRNKGPNEISPLDTRI